MKKIIFLLLYSFTAFAQSPEQKGNAELGALILAQHFQLEDDIHKAKILVSFAYKINRSNEKSKRLINDIKTNKKNEYLMELELHLF